MKQLGINNLLYYPLLL